jgi:hypothetical protein
VTKGVEYSYATHREEQLTLVALDLDMNGEANSDKLVSYNNYNRKFSENEDVLLFN